MISKACVLLFFVVMTISAEKIFWEVLSQPASNVENADLVKNRCVAKCFSKNSINAVVGADGVCSCNHFGYAISNIYMYQQGTRLRHRSLIFIPFTSTANDFKSLGMEELALTMVGAPMQFIENGPNGYLHNKKAMKLLTANSNYISYSIPNSLIEKANKAKGVIITLWLKLNALKIDAIMQFLLGGVSRCHIFQWPEGQYAFNPLNTGYISVAADMNWHHIGWIINLETKRHEARIDGETVGTTQPFSANSMLELLGDSLRVGNRPNIASADAALFCFVMQELGTKTTEEITDAIEESKWACEHY